MSHGDPDHRQLDAIVNGARAERSRAIKGFFRSMWEPQSDGKPTRIP